MGYDFKRQRILKKISWQKKWSGHGRTADYSPVCSKQWTTKNGQWAVTNVGDGLCRLGSLHRIYNSVGCTVECKLSTDGSWTPWAVIQRSWSSISGLSHFFLHKTALTQSLTRRDRVFRVLRTYALYFLDSVTTSKSC